MVAVRMASAQCAMWSGGSQCKHRSDRGDAECTFFRLPLAKINYQGGLSPAELQIWRRLTLQAAGYTHAGIEALEGKDVRICSCHFTAAQMYESKGKLKLVPHSTPYGAQTVQVAQAPTTPHPVLRSQFLRGA